MFNTAFTYIPDDGMNVNKLTDRYATEVTKTYYTNNDKIPFLETLKHLKAAMTRLATEYVTEITITKKAKKTTNNFRKPHVLVMERTTKKPLPVNNWELHSIPCYEPYDRIFHAQLGPTAYVNGFNNVTDNHIWSITWYINGYLIPEINVVRGRNYTFYVEGGSNENNDERYHPFYITDDPMGGYLSKNETERQKYKIFAGTALDAYNETIPIGLGRFCHWSTGPNNGNKDVDFSTYKSFEQYQESLTLVCEKGTPGKITWTPDEDTPDTVYYQCLTHTHPVGRINVLDSCDTQKYEKIDLKKIQASRTNKAQEDKTEEPFETNYTESEVWGVLDIPRPIVVPLDNEIEENDWMQTMTNSRYYNKNPVFMGPKQHAKLLSLNKPETATTSYINQHVGLSKPEIAKNSNVKPPTNRKPRPRYPPVPISSTTEIDLHEYWAEKSLARELQLKLKHRINNEQAEPTEMPNNKLIKYNLSMANKKPPLSQVKPKFEKPLPRLKHKEVESTEANKVEAEILDLKSNIRWHKNFHNQRRRNRLLQSPTFTNRKRGIEFLRNTILNHLIKASEFVTDTESELSSSEVQVSDSEEPKKILDDLIEQDRTITEETSTESTTANMTMHDYSYDFLDPKYIRHADEYPAEPTRIPRAKDIARQDLSLSDVYEGYEVTNPPYITLSKRCRGEKQSYTVINNDVF